MDVKVVDAGPCRKVLQVQAPAEAVVSEYEQTVKAFAAMARLPGFRPGKAPLPVVERHYAKQIEAEAKDRLVPRLYRQALEQQGLTPVAVVEVKDVVFEKAKGLGFNVTVDVAPDFKLPKYTRIAVESKPVSITDATVDEAVQRLRERFARFEPAEGRPAQAHDLVRADFDATVEGRPLAEMAPKEKALGSARDFLIYLGEPEFLPGFTAGLSGAAVGETRAIAVTFPANYPVPALAGKRAEYQVTMKGLQQRVLPEWNEEFLKRLDATSEQALREKIRVELTESAQRSEIARQKDEIARYLLDNADFDLPQSVVEQETRLTVRNMVQELSRRGGTREQIVGQQDNIVNEATRSSTDRVRLTYVLTRIAAEEKIAITDAELEERMRQLAERYEMPIERFREEMNKRNALDGLRSDLRSEKTLDYLLREAKVK